MSETKNRVSEREFSSWRSYFARETDTGERLDWWLSQILALLLNVNRRPGTSATTADKLKPDRWGESGQPKPGRFRGKELGEMFKAWAKASSKAQSKRKRG